MAGVVSTETKYYTGCNGQVTSTIQTTTYNDGTVVKKGNGWTSTTDSSGTTTTTRYNNDGTKTVTTSTATSNQTGQNLRDRGYPSSMDGYKPAAATSGCPAVKKTTTTTTPATSGCPAVKKATTTPTSGCPAVRKPATPTSGCPTVRKTTTPGTGCPATPGVQNPQKPSETPGGPGVQNPGTPSEGTEGLTNPGAPTEGTITPVAPVVTLLLSPEQLAENTRVLREASQSIKDSWNEINTKQIAELENSWAGKDAAAYIDKVRSCDKKIVATCDAIEILAKTFEKASNKLNETQNELTNYVSTI